MVPITYSLLSESPLGIPTDEIERNTRKKELKSKFKEVIGTTRKAETESFEVYCPRHDTDKLTYLKYIKENTLEAYKDAVSVVQIWGGNFNVLDATFKGRVHHEIKALGTVMVVDDLTLADEGYYFCRMEQMGMDPTITDLSELIMWAKPNTPMISMEDFFYSNNVRSNETNVDYTQIQDVALCTSTEGHPSPNLAFYDLLTGHKLSNDDDVECFPNPARKEVEDCRLTLKFIVRKEDDQNQYRCEMTHPALREEKKQDVMATINVHYPPHSLQMAGNRTAKTITCNAIANPPPLYYYKIGRAGTLVKIG